MSFKEKSFSKVSLPYDVPDLLEIQKKSFSDFLQKDVPPNQRKNRGLQKLFKTFFPVRYEDIEVDVVEYYIDEPYKLPDECVRKNLTYSAPVKVTFRLINHKTGEVYEKPKVYLGDIPLMTDKANFIINGVQRVIVSQIIKSSGIVFSNRKGELSCKIVPEKGIWVEFGISLKKELMYFSIDNKKKLLLTYFLRAIGMNTQDIISSFFDYNEVDFSEVSKIDKSFYLYENVVDDEGNVLFLAGTRVVKVGARSQVVMKEGSHIVDFDTFYSAISSLKNKKVKVISESSIRDNLSLFNTLRREKELIEFEYLREYEYSKFTKEEFATLKAISKVVPFIRNMANTTVLSVESAVKDIQKHLYDEKLFDLGEVGRYKLLMRLYKDAPEELRKSLEDKFALVKEDIIRAIKMLLKIFASNDIVDDIDHLSNRRIRAVGELLYQQLYSSMAKVQKVVEDRIKVDDRLDSIVQSVIMLKPFVSPLNEFFGTSQLSHFMDQINPLSEMTNKRRVSALGPGGFTRERAGFEVRDVHFSHYGRLCPIETPEGQNIGLILSLSTYAKVNEYGFIETPYRVVVNGKVTEEVRYFNAIDEEEHYICQSTEPVDENGYLVNEIVYVRYKGKFIRVARDQVQLMDVSPKQMFSVSTSLIPFLEHDDANRALMGSNMQRQSVPLLRPQSPLVGTGMEKVVAKQSGYSSIAQKSGIVEKVSSTYIVVKNDDGTRTRYDLMKFRPTNNNTCYNQKPIVNNGQRVEAGQVIADGPAMDNGELALGTNLLVAYMPWYGYNYEDAIIISERLVKEDILTSVHIFEYEVAVRTTKFGDEQITKDIPGVNEQFLKNLDENGIVRIGAYVKSGDILVGKLTPKSEEVESPEYKLLKVLFGEKARDSKDSSLKVPHGEGGVVIGVDRFSRENKDELPIGVNELIKVYVAQKRKVKVGDKLSGRHGNKGVVARIAPIEDMPILPDGTPVDIILNPLGVPSRMNLGQLFETMLGWAGVKLGYKYRIPVFEGPSYEEVKEEMRKAGLPETSKVRLRDGITGEYFESEIEVGYQYIMKLVHMVDDKTHARSIGPYALITQQPLGGKAQFGGQRLGEMEVWALESYGASTLLHEMLTVKSDDIEGRTSAYDGITKGRYTSLYNVPEAFKVLINEMRGLLLDVEVFDKDGNIVHIFSKDRHIFAAKSAKKKI